MNSLYGSVVVYLYLFNVGFPHFIGSSMRMAHITTEMSAFSTHCTFCHDQHLLDINCLLTDLQH